MKTLKLFLFFILLSTFVYTTGCDKQQEGEFKLPDQQVSSDKDKELQVREEMLNQKAKELDEREKLLNQRDSILTSKMLEMEKGVLKTDTTKNKESKKDEKNQKNIEKEKELNKRLDSPTIAVNDYLEYIKRGTEGNFDENMKKASSFWSNRPVDVFKKNYKDVKKFVIVSEPKVVKQENNSAQVNVTVMQTIKGKDGKDTEKKVTITYNLQADNKGKWKIKSNIIK